MLCPFAYYNVKYPKAYEQLQKTHSSSSSTGRTDFHFSSAVTGESGRWSAKADDGSDDRGTVGNQKEEVRGGDGKTTDWIQVNKKKTRSPRGMVTGGVYMRSMREKKDTRTTNRFHVLQIDDTHEKREVEMEREGKESEAEQTRKAVTADESFFLHDGSTAGSAEDFLLEVKMWTKMILSLSAEELEHLIKNLRTEYLELQMMERDLETDFDALCQEKSVSLSTQEGQNIRKNYEKEQRRLEYKLKTIRTRLAHCTHEADKRREKMDRESEEQDRGREKDDDDGETERDEKPESKGKKDAKRGGEKGGKRGKEAERDFNIRSEEQDRIRWGSQGPLPVKPLTREEIMLKEFLKDKLELVDIGLHGPGDLDFLPTHQREFYRKK
ncbi:UNVERIFIED_CONTAM: hypothetical protein K2H54_065882 [Gekko kuhli]